MRIVCLFLFAGIFLSCQTHKGPYAIRDFPKTLQPSLVRIVTLGYVGPDDATNFIGKNATTEELQRLLQCEHPLLRAVAGRALLRRPGVDHFDLLMQHLDDTALVSVDRGEWGLRYRRVSDDLIENCRWKTKEDRMKTLVAIITRHNYLESAYYPLRELDTSEKYYPFIKAMALRERPLAEQESALYALARFRKKQDIPIIRDIILYNGGLISDMSLSLMGDFPDTAYMAVLQRYFRHGLYRNIRRNDSRNPKIAFFDVVAGYKNDSSAKILTTILNRKPFLPYPHDTAELKDQVIQAIWNNPCDAYVPLRKRFAGYMKKKEEEKRRRERQGAIDILIDTTNFYIPRDTSSEPVRWY